MNIDRRGFLAAVGAVGVAGLKREAKAAEALRLGPTLNGREFAGMEGAFSAMLTPFGKDGRLNEEAIDCLVEYGIREGLAGFFVTGSAGESLLLTVEERKRTFARVAKAAKGRVKLIAHVGAVATDDSVALARYAADCGFDWVSSVAPVYFAQNWDATYFHYKMISEATDLPFLIYSFGKDIVPDRDVRFFDLKNVKGMKYTGNDFWSVQCLRRRVDKEAAFYAGNDQVLLCALALGNTFSGGIGLTYNFCPRLYADICRFAAAGDFAAAAKRQDEAGRLVDLYISCRNMSYAKAMMRYAGVDCGWCRAPHAPLSEAEYAAFAEKLDQLKIVPKGVA